MGCFFLGMGRKLLRYLLMIGLYKSLLEEVSASILPKVITAPWKTEAEEPKQVKMI